MRWIATVSPATYALRAVRDGILDGAPLSSQWPNIWPLMLLGVITVPLGLVIFGAGERYAKRTGKLKRSG
jgi:ABC-2 type transport system permease protein